MASAEQSKSAAPTPIIRDTALTSLRGAVSSLPRQESAIATAISGFVHIILAAAIAWIAFRWDVSTPASPSQPAFVNVRPVEKPDAKPDLTNDDIGLDATKKLNFNVDRLDDVSVPGILRPEAAIGIADAPAAALQNILPPPGFGGGAGGGKEGIGGASPFGDVGGFLNGKLIGQQIFGGRSGATRERMVAENGGNVQSEAAVARGLQWLKRQQKPDGRWTLVDGSVQDDFGATGLGLLPFLAAGVTHRLDAKDKNSVEYSKNVDLAIKYLIGKQQANGLLSSNGFFKHYSHAICTMALCEAYGMSNDQGLRRPAQKALDYLKTAQHSAGGFRYEPNEPGDTSVTAWCLQALQSGKLAGLAVAPESLYKVGSFLDKMQVQNGAGYGYTGPGNRPNLTAAGLLCRAYLGWGPRHPAMLAGVENLKRNMPAPGKQEIYYYYYATQVMHFCATENDWKLNWNPKMRDLLVATQDSEAGPNQGSWNPETDTLTGQVGGRLCATSLSLLTLEVYYRHLPLYNRKANLLRDDE